MSSQRETEIKDAVAKFESLLRNQIERNDRIKDNIKVDKKAKIIGICDGDGIGPIITKAARSVLDVLLDSEDVIIKEINGFNLANRLKEGKTVPDDILAEIKSCDVLLKGPTTTPSAESGVNNIESANVFLRKELDLFANVRPVTIPDKNIDWIFFRENTEGEYALGSQGIEISETLAFDFKVTTKEGTKRIAKLAFDYANNNNKERVSIVTKANIMKKTDGNFLNLCKEVALDYPNIKVDSWYVDIMAANLINNDMNKDFQVFILPNLYGDIITDEAAQLQGGVGTAGSANIGSNYAMFEAIHGSAPRMIEDGLEAYANPSSILRATSMMLRHIGLNEKAKLLDEAIDKALEEGINVTGLKDGNTCEELTKYVLEYIR
jgi:isocitrate dehydrogenase (NAD+)